MFKQMTGVAARSLANPKVLGERVTSATTEDQSQALSLQVWPNTILWVSLSPSFLITADPRQLFDPGCYFK